METYNAKHRQIRRLEEEEKIESFCCGDADLDDFIVNEAPFYRDAMNRYWFYATRLHQSLLHHRQ